MIRQLEHDELLDAWSAAQPFHHVVIDEAISVAQQAELNAALEDEPAQRIASEHFEVHATAEPLTQPALRCFQRSFFDRVAPLAGALAKQPLSRCDMRGYAYGPGHYLLPHSDRDGANERRIAYALYVSASDDIQGGELELYRCTCRGDEIVTTEAMKRIVATPRRLVMFQVTSTSIHRVREVTAGLRVSVAGWFYR